MTGTRQPTLTIRLFWEPERKKWLVRWTTVVGRRIGNKWRRIDADVAIGEADADKLADVVIRELESWLPFVTLGDRPPGGSSVS